MIEKTREILKNQKKALAVFAGSAIFIFVGIAYLTINDSSHSESISYHKAISLPGDKINAQEMWMNQVETQNRALDNQSKLLEQKFKYIESLVLDQKKKEEEIEKEKVDLKREIERLKQELTTVSDKTDQRSLWMSSQEGMSNETNGAPLPLKNINENANPTISFSPFSDPFTTNNRAYNNPGLGECSREDLIKPGLTEIMMEFKAKDERHKTVNVDAKIFAGTTVQALLVSSVDAVCGVFSNSDPVPIKLRILDNGHLPKGVNAKLKGGLIIGSAYGNLSNERVYIRLERMSLINPNGEGLEMEVAGYVSGEDGRFGLRGLVIDKSTKMVKNAAYSGFLSGTGQVLQAAVSKRPVDCWNTYAVGADVLQQGAATGAGNAFDMLADYYIKRAEQVQPVLQVNAGRIVDVTFTFGTPLGDLNTKEKIKESRLRTRQR